MTLSAVSEDVYIYPLSFAQERLWFLQQMEPESTAYNMTSALRLQGNLDLAALEQTIQGIQARHEVLRTTIEEIDGTVVQAISSVTGLIAPLVDLTALSPAEQTAEVKRRAMVEETTCFDLAQEILIRVQLLRLSPSEHILLLTLHHIITDAWSIGVIVQEISVFYPAYAQGKPAVLPELPIQYGDFADWQREWLAGAVLDKRLDYWTHQLAGAPNLLELPTDHPRPAIQTFRGRKVIFTLDPILTERLKQLAQQQEVTLFMLLLAAFGTLLYRYNGQDDMVIGSPIANRTRQEFEQLIGFFVNTLALRLQFEGNLTFEDLLHQVRESTLDAYVNQDLPFARLVEALNVERSLSYSSLVQVMFVLQNATIGDLELPGLTLSPLEFEDTTAKFDLTLSMQETARGLQGTWEYNVDLFESETIHRMAAHFQILLEGIAANPQMPVSQLPLLTLTERQQLLEEWNDTATAYPQDQCIHHLFELQVERTPDAVAVVFENQQLTYRKLNQRANQLAHYLQGLGVQPETLVGICVERSLEMVVGLMAILKAGGAYVPLDPSYPQKRLAYMLQDAAVPVLLTQQTLIAGLPPHSAQVVCLDRDWSRIAGSSRTNIDRGTQLDHLAYVIYTSGSTGKPKGVMNGHLGVCNRLLWMQDQYPLTPEDRVLQKTPFSFDVSVWEFFWPLLTGARLVVAKPNGHKDSAYLAEVIVTQNITTIHFVPPMLQAFLAEPALDCCNSLKRVICSGEALSADLQTQFFKRLNCELHNLYGPTEAAIDVSYWSCQPDDPRTTVPIGRPVANTQLYVLDADLQPVPIGITGELHIGGIQVARGYLNRPDLTRDKFIANPFGLGRLYKTGDLARYLPDGTLEYLSRIDHQVKIRGFRIELGEIEAILLTHPEVYQGIVICREDTPGDKRLVAYVVDHDIQNPGELRDFLKAQLPEYMVPSTFVQLEVLPLTPNGKVDRKALPMPDSNLANVEAVVTPQTPSQELITNLFRIVLKVHSVGLHQSFFELGGHSLLATQLISRLRQTFELEIPLRTLFEAPTVFELDQHLCQLRQEGSNLTFPPITPAPRNGQNLPLSWAQERLWFLDQLEGQSSTYNISGTMHLIGLLNLDALEQAFQTVVERHESLRTHFPTVNGSPIQEIVPADQIVVFKREQWCHLSADEWQGYIQQAAQAEAETSFDLTTGPLLRVRLLQHSSEEAVVVVTLHHIISDGWSIGVLIREVTELYQAGVEGKSAALEPLQIQYGDYTLWQQRLQQEIWEQQLGYWQKQLVDAPALLQLPTDYPRPAVQSYRGAHQSFHFSSELTQQLEQFSQNAGVTLFMTLLTGFATLLYRYSGQSDLLIGSPIANRNRTEIEPLIGCFINTLVLRLNIEEQASFAELLRQVRECTLDGYAHQDVPFEQVVDMVQPERSLSHSPLFQVMFVLQNTPQETLDLPGVTSTVLPSENLTTKFDLALTMELTASGLEGTWEYCTDLFAAETITRMSGHLQQVLAVVMASPEAAVSQLPLLTPEERHQLVVEWNDTAFEFPHSPSIHQLFEAQVAETPEAVAVVFRAEQLTYAALNERANQLAHYLQSLGVGPNVLVGICVERSPEMIVALLGILKAGGAYVPLDPKYPTDRLAYMVSDAGLSILLTQQSLVATLPDYQAQVVCLDADEPLIAQHPTNNPVSGVGREHWVYVIYTSGSTGQPKGVMIPHGALVEITQSLRANHKIERGDRILQFASMNFDTSAEEIYPALSCGATIVLRTDEFLTTGPALMQACRDWQLTVLDLPTAYWHQLTADLAGATLAAESWVVPESLRLVIIGGEAAGLEQVRLWHQHVAPQWILQGLSQPLLANTYGPSEATIVATSRILVPPESDDLPGAEASIGRPLHNVQVYLLDCHLQPVPIGVPGEIYVGGVGLAHGYLNRPELTAETFIDNPLPDSHFPASERLYRTGDLGCYLPDGNIVYLGRIDHQVKIRGFRIELGEIEVALSTHPQVQQGVVIVREDTPGDKRLVAYLVNPDTTLAPADLRDFLKTQLPDYMVPSAFVQLSNLPLAPSGKTDRNALPCPEIDLLRDQTFVAPQTPLEQKLATIWQQVLGIEQVSIHDNFFAIGGDSILSIQVIARAKQAGMNISAKQIFQYQTIAELSRVAQVTQALTIPQTPASGNVPLTPIQTWFLKQNWSEPHHYNQAVLLCVPPTLNPDHLASALVALFEHHDALRLKYSLTPLEWQQTYGQPPNPIPLETIDLSHYSTDERRSQLETIANEYQASLNLSDSCLMRMVLFRLGAKEARLLIIIHHLVVDGVSWRILLSDLATTYQQLVQGQPIQLPPKTSSFQTWARQLQLYAQSETLRSQLDYWLHQPWDQVRSLSVDRDDHRSLNLAADQTTVELTLSQDQTQQLLRDVPSAYNTQINDVLLTALALSLSTWTDTDLLLIDLEGHGRQADLFENIDLSRTVGWFTSVFPVLLHLDPQADLAAAIKSIKEQLRQIPDFGIGYGIGRYLSDDSSLGAQLAALPQAQISFNYLGQFDEQFDAVKGEAQALGQPALESTGSVQSPEAPLSHLFDITALIVNGQFQMSWRYTHMLHERSTVEGLARSYREALQALIEHCVSSAAGGYTPSDFPDAGLSQTQLDQVLAAVGKPKVDAIYPLSGTQQGLLFHTLYEPDSGVYVTQMVLTLEGSVDIQAWKRAWQTLSDRHQILRTLFVWESLEQPLQIVCPIVELPWTTLDWRHLSAEIQQQQLNAILDQQREQGFNLSQAPLMTLHFIQTAEHTYQLLWSHHHILLDGWCLPILFQELLLLYETNRQENPYTLNPPYPYQDYIRWLQRQDATAAETVWREMLQGFETPTPLPFSQVSQSPSHFEEQTLDCSPVLTQELQALAQEQSITLATLLQASWALLLSRYSGESDIVFGVTVSGRPGELPGVETMVGLFINTLPLRLSVPHQGDLLPWLQEVHQRQLTLQEYAYSPLSSVQKLSDIATELPLFESILVFENYPVDASVQARAAEAGLSITQLQNYEQTNYPLTLSVTARGELHLEVSYDASRFSGEAIARMLGHWQVVLEAIATSSRSPIEAIPLLTTAERHQLLVEWNDTAHDYPQDHCIHQLFEAQVEQTPNAIAVVYEDEQLTYDALNKQANQLAHQLHKLGVGPDVLVGIYLEKSPALLVSILAILKAGGTYVPLDIRYPQERIAYMLADAAVTVLISQESCLAFLPKHNTQLLCLDTDQTRLRQPTINLMPSATAENRAYVIYTSGSTGQPKGVAVAHCNLVNAYFGWEEAYRLKDQTSSHLQMASCSFDVFTGDWVRALCSGAKLVLCPRELLLDAEQLYALIRREAIDCAEFVPAVFRPLFDYLISNDRTLSFMNVLIVGSDFWSMAEYQQFQQICGPQTRLINSYGVTEATIDSCYFEAEGEVVETCTKDIMVSIGRPFSNIKLYVLDREGQPVPIGVAGELYIGGAGVALGYLHRADLTAAKFIRNPFGTGRLYKTGDLARYRADGNLECLGRIDHQVKIRGFRIELGEIEAILSTHPQVQQGVIMVREDSIGDKRLVAYVVNPDTPLTPGELGDFLKAQLPDYMVPSAFVQLDALPLTPNGKLDRKALPRADLAPLRDRTFVAPQTPLQQSLAEIWQQVLGIKQVGLHDNFFAIGGDSILSIQMVSRAKQAGIKITAKQIFQQRTIAELSRVAELRQALEIPQTRATGNVPLNPIQTWFLEQNWSKLHHYNQAVLLCVPPTLNPDHLVSALVALFEHHDALRLKYKFEPQGWQQIYGNPPAPIPLKTFDLSHYPTDELEQQLETLANEYQVSLNLIDSCLMRVVLFRLGANEARLLIIIHHLVVDGVSWRILLSDLATAYQQREQGQSIQLPAKTSSFQTWARQLQSYAQSETLRSQLDYWLDQPWSQVRSLPVDYGDHRSPNMAADQATVEFTLSQEQTQQLLRDVPSAYNTQINDILITALALSLSTWTDTDLLLIDLEGHGRQADLFENIDLSRTVGWFTSVFPVMLHLDPQTDLVTAIKAIKEQLRQIPDFGIGYGIGRYLSDDSSLRAQLAALPQAQISFNYLGQFDEQFDGANGEAQALGQPAPESSGSVQSPESPRSYLLDINALIVNGQFQMSWSYSSAIHERSTVKGLSHRYQEALQALIKHCVSPTAGGYTPSDFPEARLSQEKLDQVLAVVGKPNVDAIYPLSGTQQGLLFHTLYAPDSGVYFVQTVLTLKGAVNELALRRAWQTLIDRHPVLRTLFVWETLEQPLQIVCSTVELPWITLDWRHLSTETQQKQQLNALLSQQREQGFDLGQAPLMTLHLIQTEEYIYQLVWSHHHILLDGWCAATLFRELLVFYKADCQGQPCSMSPAYPYQDYICWLERQDTATAETFWRGMLQEVEAPTPLPFSQVGVRSHSPSGFEEQELACSPALTQALQTLAQKQNITLATLVLASWALLLSRYSGESDVVFGVTVSGRPGELSGVETMVGLFINTLPLRVCVPHQGDLLPWLQEVHQRQLTLQEYAYSSLAEVQKLSDIAAETPLFESILVFENYPVDASVQAQAADAGVSLSQLQSYDQTNYPLTLSVIVEDTLYIEASYDTSRFSDESMARMLEHWQMVLEGIAANPRQTLGLIPLLTQEERHRLLVEWNDTAVQYPQDQRIHQLFEAQVEETPDAVAVVFEDQQLNYGELNAQANQLAHQLQGLGVGPEVLVGLCVERSFDLVVGLLGILKAGGVYVPLDPTYPRERLSYILNDAAVDILLTQSALSDRLPANQAKVVYLDDNTTSFPTLSSPVICLAKPTNLAYIIYTSGSTGQPKGAMVEHLGCINHCYAKIHDLSLKNTDIIAQTAPIGFDISVWQILTVLFIGGKVEIIKNDTVRDPDQLFKEIQRRKISILQVVPSLLRMMLEVCEQSGTPRLPYLRWLVVTGEAFPTNLLDWWFEKYPDIPLINAYGPAECSDDVTHHYIDDSRYAELGTVPIGQPVVNTQIYILDPYLNPVPIGVEGELHVGGVGVGRGYLNRPELTAEKFITNPFSDSEFDRLYKTGDLARYLPDGNIEYLGRIDHQVKIRGFRIELGELEAVLQKHPQVREVVVIVREDYPGDKRLVAYVIFDETVASPTELRQFLKETLPDYMVPAAFVDLDALPLTPNGKIDRKALPSPEFQPASDQVFIPPRNPLELELTQIWSEVLQVEPISIIENFFDLGGHSLLAISLMVRIQQRLGHTLPLVTLFQGATVEQQALLLQQKAAPQVWSP
ncbi:MAG: amino acid adenylation domain-containing protein, partial [Symploca sp. SIO2C1]|nr:amino acid adenylation domain-containing protein [Symploca sp. SIO2C1]